MFCNFLPGSLVVCTHLYIFCTRAWEHETSELLTLLSGGLGGKSVLEDVPGILTFFSSKGTFSVSENTWQIECISLAIVYVTVPLNLPFFPVSTPLVIALLLIRRP